MTGYGAKHERRGVPERDRRRAGVSADRIRIGFLAQENLPVPPPVPRGSIARIVRHLAHNLAADEEDRFDVNRLLASPFPADRFTWRAQAERLSGYYDDLVGIRSCQS
jgi:hypothetical protein